MSNKSHRRTKSHLKSLHNNMIITILHRIRNANGYNLNLYIEKEEIGIIIVQVCFVTSISDYVHTFSILFSDA